MRDIAPSDQKSPFHKTVKIVSDAAGRSCAKDFLVHRDKKGLRGLEGIFVNEIVAQFKKRGCTAATEAARRDWELKGSYQTDGRERIDVVVTCPDGKLGIEAKVCSLPRLVMQSPNQSLYDIGQISKDHWQLQSTKLNDAYCVVAVHGPFVDENNKGQILRRFHNQLFVDFTNSMERGELKNEKGEMSRKLQIESCQELGFHLPFEKARDSDFCRFIERDLAIVGFWAGPMKVRR